MKKKICIFIIMVVFTFVGLKTINASTLTKTDYLNKIEELENEDFKTILVKRYIEGENWDVIASAIFVSKRTAIRWHDAALELLKLDDQDTQNN